MSRFVRLTLVPLFALVVMLSTSGCKSTQDQNAANANQAATPDSSDPASANLAPVSNDSSAPAQGYSQSAPQSSSPQTAPPPDNSQSGPPPDSGGNYDQASNQYPGDSDYGEQPDYTAPQPPPPLPDYDQPPAPGDGYLWTPGYWSYAPTGYYWVPGVWVQAPYEGALWTPGYWGFFHSRYSFFHGYWGPHIGFYGGINYGYGYTGVGYQGGYWNGGRFNYNRSVNNINVNVVHNVYNRTVINNYVTTNSRVSFNGGSGGVQVRPRPQELSALREPHAPPMQTQLQVQKSASVNRAQFAAVNHGRPASPAVTQPVMADHNVRPVAAPPMRGQPAPQRGATPQVRPNVAQPAPANQINRNQPAQNKPATQQPNRNEPNRNPAGQVAPHPAARTAPVEQAPRQVPPQRQAAPQRQAPPPRPAAAPERQAPPPRQAAPERQPPPQKQATPQRQAAPRPQPKPQEKPKPEEHPR